MKKRILICLAIFYSLFMLYAADSNTADKNRTVPNGSSANIIKFIKGDILEKTAAVRDSENDEAAWLSSRALNFVLENKALLGNDRDLEGLCVAAILSIPVSYYTQAPVEQRQELLSNFIKIFQEFDKNSTIQIAVLSKYLYLKDVFASSSFTGILNDFLVKNSKAKADPAILKAVINTLGTLGDASSFLILYNLWFSENFKPYYTEIEQSLSLLSPYALNEILSLIDEQPLNRLQKLFRLLLSMENNEISSKDMSEIAEKMLNAAILSLGNTPESTAISVDVQVECIRILNKNRWTRASDTALKFFEIAVQEYEDGSMKQKDFVEVIESLSTVASVNAVNPLIAYLTELNNITVKSESNNPVSSDVIIAVINTLGAIGNKAAFDSLLAVTYLNYDDSVLSAARDALAGLKW